MLDDTTRGSMAQWNSFLRFKHLSSGYYLSIDPQRTEKNEENLAILVCSKSKDINTIFELDPTTVSLRGDNLVSQNSIIRLKHVASSCWVHSSSSFSSDSNLGKFVGCYPLKDDKEAFTLVAVEATEVKDLDFITDCHKVLERFVCKVRNGKVLACDRSAVVSLLEGMIFFCSNQMHDFRTSIALDAVVTVDASFRERQKLIREQNVLELLFIILRELFIYEEVKSRKDLECQAYLSSKYILQLCYRIVQFSLQEYRRNQEYVAKKLGLMLTHIGYEIFAEETITVLMKGNKKLVENSITVNEIDTLIKLVEDSLSSWNPKYLIYLSGLCNIDGEPVQSIQEMICKSLFLDNNHDFLIKLKYDSKSEGSSVANHLNISWNQGKSGIRLFEVSKLMKEGDDESKRIVNFFIHQLDLYANMCRDRQYIAIEKLTDEFPMDILLSCMYSEELVGNLKAALCTLLVHLHVDRDPNYEVKPIQFAKLWREIPSDVTTYIHNHFKGIDCNSNIAISKFDEVKVFIETIFSRSWVDRKVLGKSYTVALVQLLSYLIRFGFYSLAELRHVTQSLLINCQMSKENGNWELKGENKSNSINDDDIDIDYFNHSEIAREVLFILQYVADLRLDWHMTSILALLKGALDETHSARDENSVEKKVNMIVQRFVVDSDYQVVCNSTLLKVLAQYVMHPSTDVSTMAMKVFLRQFNQCREIGSGAKHVQLLVSDTDVKDYFQVKEDLETLKILVERSELWITAMDLDSFDLSDDESNFKESDVSRNRKCMSANYEKMSSILERMKSLCVQQNNEEILPNSHGQILLRNLNVHHVVLDILRIPFNKSTNEEMNSIVFSSHEVLQLFCLYNKKNQEAVFHHRELFMDFTIQDFKSLTAIFKENENLCQQVDNVLVQHVILCLEAQGKNILYLQFLKNIVYPENQPLKHCQDVVIKELAKIFELEASAIADVEASFSQNSDSVSFHIELVNLLSLCTMGRNVYTETKSHLYLQLDDIVNVVMSENVIIEVKDAYLHFLKHCYIDTEVEMKVVYTSSHIWDLFRSFTGVFDHYIADSSEFMEKFMETILELIMSFFKSPFFAQSTSILSNKWVFVQLLNSVYGLTQMPCSTNARWKVNQCVKTLSSVAKMKNVLVPHNLDCRVVNEVNLLSMKHLQGEIDYASSNPEKTEDSENDVVGNVQGYINRLDSNLKSLSESENSIIVDIFLRPEMLIGTINGGMFVQKSMLIIEALFDNKEETLALHLLKLYSRALTSSSCFNGDKIRQMLLEFYFGRNELYAVQWNLSISDNSNVFESPCIERFGITLYELQCFLSAKGASQMLVNLINRFCNKESIFAEIVSFGINLLEGGNLNVQNQLFTILEKGSDSRSFFEAMFNALQEFQLERKSSIVGDTYVITDDDEKAHGSESFLETEERNTSQEMFVELILRFLQLLCEHHHTEWQNLLRCPINSANFNLVSVSMALFESVCGSTLGNPELMGLLITESNVHVINQLLRTMTEFCQGPCQENQSCIALHESSGLSILSSILFHDILPLSSKRMDLVLELKNNVCKLILAVMESRVNEVDSVVEKITLNFEPRRLHKLSLELYSSSTEHQRPVSFRDLGHNMYVLYKQLLLINKHAYSQIVDTSNMVVDPVDSKDKALIYYAQHTGQIEVNNFIVVLDFFLFCVLRLFIQTVLPDTSFSQYQKYASF